MGSSSVNWDGRRLADEAQNDRHVVRRACDGGASPLCVLARAASADPVALREQRARRRALRGAGPVPGGGGDALFIRSFRVLGFLLVFGTPLAVLGPLVGEAHPRAAQQARGLPLPRAVRAPARGAGHGDHPCLARALRDRRRGQPHSRSCRLGRLGQHLDRGRSHRAARTHFHGRAVGRRCQHAHLPCRTYEHPRPAVPGSRTSTAPAP